MEGKGVFLTFSLFLGLTYGFGPDHILNLEIKCFIDQYCYKCRTLVDSAMAQGQFYCEPKGWRTWLRDSICSRKGLMSFFCFPVMTLWPVSRLWSSLYSAKSEILYLSSTRETTSHTLGSFLYLLAASVSTLFLLHYKFFSGKTEFWERRMEQNCCWPKIETILISWVIIDLV